MSAAGHYPVFIIVTLLAGAFLSPVLYNRSRIIAGYSVLTALSAAFFMSVLLLA